MTGGKAGTSNFRKIIAGAFLFLSAFAVISSAASIPLKKADLHDPFEIIAEVRRLEGLTLWPGFEPEKIPLGLFDGERTYLIDFPGMPEGFAPVTGRPDILSCIGRHPSIFGNTCVQINGLWMASLIPVRRSEFTGKKISLTETAAVVIHEKFHVFQAVRHPAWKPNDGVLLSYPQDTAEILDRRSREIESLRRAVLSLSPGDTAWAQTAAALRRERYAGLEEGLIRYEREIRRLEGLAEYVEYKAAGKPAAEEPLPLGFAPGAVRELGYTAGRWTAVLLDRFVPGWQADVENGTVAFPEDLLENYLRGRGGQAEFSEAELAQWREDVHASLAEKEAENKRLLESMNDKTGVSIVINALRRPLRFESFGPFSIEAVAPRVLIHRQGFALKNESGRISLFGTPALTESDARGRVIRILIPGVTRRIRYAPGLSRLRFFSEELSIDLKPVRIRSQGSARFIIELR